jgi:zinc transport system permease protein
MLEIFHYSFMIRALLVGSIIACIAPMIGIFLVSKRYSLMADTLSHVCLAGVAIGMLLQIYPVYTALIVSVFAAICIEKLSKSKRISGESTLALFLSGGLAVATVIISFARGFTVDLFSYLFGSISTVSEGDVIVTVLLALVIVVVVALLYKELFYVSFDEESARVSGLPATQINYIFMILAAITIALSIRIVGVLLISALMVIPVLAGSLIAKSFKQTLLSSIMFSLFMVLTGLFLSYYFNLAAGGAIVLLSLVGFGILHVMSTWE